MGRETTLRMRNILCFTLLTCCDVDVDWCEVSLRLLQELELVFICLPPKVATVLPAPVPATPATATAPAPAPAPPPFARLPLCVGVTVHSVLLPVLAPLGWLESCEESWLGSGEPLFLLKLSMSVEAGLSMLLCELSEKSVICTGERKGKQEWLVSCYK